MDAAASYDATIPAREPWSRVLRKGQVLRIVDLFGQQAVDTLFYNAADPAERYDAQQTLLTQNAAYIGSGTKLISNDGNVLATVVADNRSTFILPNSGSSSLAVRNHYSGNGDMPFVGEDRSSYIELVYDLEDHDPYGIGNRYELLAIEIDDENLAGYIEKIRAKGVCYR